jgi:hypothetical protein
MDINTDINQNGGYREIDIYVDINIEGGSA